MVVDLLDLLDAVPPSAPRATPGRWQRRSGDENMRKDHGDGLPVLVPVPKPA